MWDPAKGDGVQLVLDIEEDGRRRQIFSKYIDPKNNLADRHWFDYDLPLDVTREQDVHLIFKALPGPKGDINCDHGAWSDPRIVY
jgi:hypothetical protein